LKRKNNQITLGDALESLMDQYQLNAKINEIKIYESWDQMLGVPIAKHTVSKQLFGTKLLIKLDSAALRSELSFSKSKLIKSLNEAVGVEMITEITFS
jgi:predicted nucleic acid-binding Zn ribbon protein|tara:strand:+ start:23 stop:316 length:294 start_codon:yes stop_codon:yes gene_type:complete